VWSPPAATQQGWPSYSPDGEWIYFVHIVGSWDYAEGGTSAISRVRRDDSSAQEVVPAPAGGGWLSPSLSPDGNSLAYLGTDGTVVVRALANGTTRTIAGLSAASVVWSPNAARLLIAGRAGLSVVGADGSGQRQLRRGVVWG
jgi:Tol biopolymer transport system component